MYFAYVPTDSVGYTQEGKPVRARMVVDVVADDATQEEFDELAEAIGALADEMHADVMDLKVRRTRVTVYGYDEGATNPHTTLTETRGDAIEGLA